MASNSSWGIEVGASAVKAIRLVRDGEKLSVADYEIIAFKDVLTTPDLDVHEAIRVNLDQLKARHDFGSDPVIVSVPGHLAFARFAKMPPVQPKEIPQIVHYEAVQQIPFPIDQVEWDYQIFEQEDNPEVGVGIFAITKERVAEFLTDYRSVELEIDQLTLSPLAVYNTFYYEEGGTDDAVNGKVFIDIGSQSTDVIIAADGAIWMRTLPIGGNNFTEALVRAFKLSFSKAEKLKRESSTSKYSRQIITAMKPVFADLVQELQRSLAFYQSSNRDVQLNELICIGSTFRQPGLRKFIQQQLQIDIRRVDNFKRLNIEGKQESDFADNAMNFATAYGLALQGLGEAKVEANILPTAMVQQRIWKKKAIWFHAAAAVIALAALLSLVSILMVSQGYQSKRETVKRQVEPLIRDAREQANEVIQLDDPKNRIENFRRMIDYRDVWPLLVEDISDAIAQVNPQDELMDPDYSKLLNSQLAGDQGRQQRRRIYIDDIQVRYVPRKAVAIEPKPGAPADTELKVSLEESLQLPLSPDAFWAQKDQLIAHPQNEQMKILPPRYVVSITGTSPYQETAKLLNDAVLNSLEKSSEKPNRPYDLIVIREIVLDPVGSDGDTSTRGGGSAADAMPDTATRGGATSTRATATRSGVRTRPNPSTQGDAALADFSKMLDNAQTLPSFPLEHEDRSSDWKFTISFEVELKRPMSARQAVLGGGDPASDTPPTQPDEQAPAEPETDGTTATHNPDPQETQS